MAVVEFLTFLLTISYTDSQDSSVIDSITPDLYILDSDGNQKRLDDIALTFNSHVTLICRTASSDSQLLWQFALLDHNTFRPVVESAYLTVDRTKAGEIALKLTKIRFSMAGTYQCSNKVASRQINIHVYGILNAVGSTVRLLPKREVVGHVQFQTYVFDTSSPPTVACQFRVGKFGIKYALIRWKGGLFSTNPGLYTISYSADEESGYIWSNLTITQPTFDRALYGKYKCLFNIIPGSMESAEVEVTVPPVIKRSDHGIGHYTGKEFSYLCEVIAYPPIIDPISWSRDDQPIQLSPDGKPYVTGYDWADRVRFESDEYPNDRLVFDPVLLEDRAVYSCFVRSPLGNATGALFLRVKDRWAVVWPTIGIALELIVLVVIILLYEIKRRKKAKIQGEMEADLYQKNSSSGCPRSETAGDMSLRQRPVRT